MSNTDTIRIVTGVGVLIAAGGIAVMAVKSEPKQGAPDASPSPSVMVAAAERGIDLTNGTPSQDRDRLLTVFESGTTTDFSAVDFRNGLYFAAGTQEVAQGYLTMAHPDGSARLICTVVDGKLQGPGLRLHASGKIQQSFTHKDGRLIGQFIEFYEDGSLKLRCMARETTEQGGTAVSEISVGKHSDDGYARSELGEGRIQFIYADGTVEGANEDTPIDAVEGWMLFHDTLLQGQKAYTADSRRLKGPS